MTCLQEKKKFKKKLHDAQNKKYCYSVCVFVHKYHLQQTVYSLYTVHDIVSNEYKNNYLVTIILYRRIEYARI